MCLDVLPAHISVHHVCTTQGGQKRASVPLELELLAGSQLAVLWVQATYLGFSEKAASTLNL